jgi:hypothetical protein
MLQLVKYREINAPCEYYTVALQRVEVFLEYQVIDVIKNYHSLWSTLRIALSEFSRLSGEIRSS